MWKINHQPCYSNNEKPALYGRAPALLPAILFLCGCAGVGYASLMPPPDVGRYEMREVEVRGGSMAPFLPAGSRMALLEGYYNDHPALKGEAIAYKYAGDIYPLIKTVRAVGGDRWKVLEAGDFYEVYINGVVLKNNSGLTYRISKGSGKRLMMYARGYPVVPVGACLIFGEAPGGSLDSSVFGLVAQRDFAGRLVRVAR